MQVYSSRVGHRWTFLGSCQQIQDVVIFYEKLTYSKTFRPTLTKKNWAFPRGGVVMGTICENGKKIVIFAHF